MKRLIVGGAIAAILAGGAGVSLADPGPNDPPGNGHGNTYGLCNAYGHNGGNNQGQAFQGLQQAAREADEADGSDDYTTTAEEVGAFCAERGGKPGGGKPGGGKG